MECKVLITVYDVSDVSITSDPAIFQTNSTPTVTVSTIGTVTSSSNLFTATYAQSESVLASYWLAFLYNSGSEIISQSGIQTSSTLSYLFDGMQTGSSYYVVFQATSSNGLIGTSGLIPFSVAYSAPNINLEIQASNTVDAGILLEWNVTQILGVSENATFVSGEKLNVKTGNVIFSSVGISSDFTLKTWMEDLSNYTISTDSQVIALDVAPTNINSLWIPDSTQTTPKYSNFSVRNAAPTNPNDIWIPDSTQTTEWILGLYVDTLQPPSNNYVWHNSVKRDIESSKLDLEGENGTLRLEYYNSTFYLCSYDLLSVKTILSTVAITGSKFYICIQQIGNIYNLIVEVVL